MVQPAESRIGNIQSFNIAATLFLQRKRLTSEKHADFSTSHADHQWIFPLSPNHRNMYAQRLTRVPSCCKTQRCRCHADLRTGSLALSHS